MFSVFGNDSRKRIDCLNDLTCPFRRTKDLTLRNTGVQEGYEHQCRFNADSQDLVSSKILKVPDPSGGKMKQVILIVIVCHKISNI